MHKLILIIAISFIVTFSMQAQTASRFIASASYTFNNDSARLVNTDSSHLIYNTNTRGINHYDGGPTEDGYNLGELNNHFLYDTSYYYHVTSGVLNITGRQTIQYNNDGFETSFETENLNGGVFVPGAMFTFTRNSDNRVVGENHNIWSGSAFGTVGKTTFLYNSDNKNISRVTEDSIGGTTNFRPSSKDTSTYNGNNQRLRTEFYNWNNTAWVLSGYIAFLYDGQGREIRKQNRSIYNGTTVGAYDDSTVYDSGSRISEEFSQSDTLGNFAYRVRHYYGATGDNDSMITYFNNLGNMVYIRNYYLFDSQHRITSHSFLLGSSSTKDDYEYNSYNQVTTQTEYTIDNTNNWVLARKYYNYYELYNDDFSGISNISDGGDIQLYPNPSDGSFQLMISPDIQNGEIRLYNISGQTVYYGKLNEGSNTVSISGLPKGYYVAIINNSRVAYSRKVVVQ